MLAPQRHRYRRTTKTTSVGRSPSAIGPRCCRVRWPCPRIPTPHPVGRPGAPHAGQLVGRSTSTDGSPSSHRLTLIPLRMIDRGAPALLIRAPEHRPGGRSSVLRVTYLRRHSCRLLRLLARRITRPRRPPPRSATRWR
jgi:hypothetical protein